MNQISLFDFAKAQVLPVEAKPESRYRLAWINLNNTRLSGREKWFDGGLAGLPESVAERNRREPTIHHWVEEGVTP